MAEKWTAGYSSMTNQYYIDSDDFTHDVRLTVTGDFESKEQLIKYITNLAERLSMEPTRKGE